ncbi:MAG: response regulator [Candidatus Latescibacterota bacterium]|nr:MAG: response regulator [Candidatus Latescibacterota bacterium]
MPRTILLVDDDKDLLCNLEAVLRKNGYETVQAHSAAEGLRTALAVRPDLIVLDVSMETDTAGFEFFNQIRSRREGSRYASVQGVPIVLLTAIHQVTNSRFSLDDRNGFLPGIEAVFTKPVGVEALLAKVRELVP